MESGTVRIYDIMACNVYWDFENSPLKKEQHKFLVSLYPTPGVATPDLIEKLSAYGPDGYQVSISNQMQNNINKDGWIYDPTLNYYWYMLNTDKRGFMKEGEYTIEIKCKDGSVVKKSRMQKNAPSDAMVNSYLKYKQKLLDSFSPSKNKPLKSGLKDVKCKWLTLKDVNNFDAFYVYRITEAKTPMEFNTQKLTWWDNIYIQRVYNNDPKSGQNRGEVTIGNELKPHTSYGYFVEITDGNVQSDANICIFQPHQFFTTPA